MKTNIFIVILWFFIFLNDIIYSNTAEDYNNKGHNLFMKGFYDEAIVEYKKAVEADPTFAVYHKNLALAFFCKGDFDNTIEECRKAVELSKSMQPFSWAFIHGILAQAHFYKHEYKLAVFHYVNALNYNVRFTNKFIKKVSPYVAKYPARRTIGTPTEMQRGERSDRGVANYIDTPSLWIILKYPNEKGMENYVDSGEGEGIIYGKVLLNGKPLSNAVLSIVLNDGEIGKDMVKVDEVGGYKVKIPLGKYSLNAFKVYDERVRDKVALQNAFMYIGHIEEKQIVFHLNEVKTEYELPIIEIVDPVKVITPEYTAYDTQRLSDNSKVLEWAEINEVEKYLIEVSRIKKGEGDNIEYHPIIGEPDFYTVNNSLVFSEFKKFFKSFEPGEYGFKIYAVDKDNEIISYAESYITVVFTQ